MAVHETFFPCLLHVPRCQHCFKLEGTFPSSLVPNPYCDISILDPNKQLLSSLAVSKNGNGTPIAATRNASTNPNSFRLSLANNQLNSAQRNNGSGHCFGGPIIEYTCGDAVRPVPMVRTRAFSPECNVPVLSKIIALTFLSLLSIPCRTRSYINLPKLIDITIQELSDRCNQILFQLRVNPRNTCSLVNAAVLIHVPSDIDGATAQVSSVGRSIGKGTIDTQWSDITRILSWRVGELYSGAVCEFEAIFPPRSMSGGSSDAEPVIAQEKDPKNRTSYAEFPVLLRYDCEGCLLSDVDLDCSGWGGEGANNSSPIVKRKFRVYHREV